MMRALRSATIAALMLFFAAGSALGAPDLSISALTVGAPVTNKNGSFTFSASFTVTNVGDTATSGSWWDKFYVSSDATLGSGDWSFPVLRTTPLAAGESYTVTRDILTPTGWAAGTYTVFAKTDTDGLVGESGESNNVTGGLPITFQLPDLAISGLTVGSATTNKNGSFTFDVSFTVTNTGSATAAGGWNDTVYVSTDASFNWGDWSAPERRTSSLAPGASYTVSKTITTPTGWTAGTYTVFARTDSAGEVGEPEAGNATGGVPLVLRLPDLVISGLAVGAPVTNADGSYAFPATFTVTNTGDAIAAGGWWDRVYVSEDPVFNWDWSVSVRRADPLAPGASYTVTKAVVTPTGWHGGTYTVFARTDTAAEVGEPEAGNGTGGVPITFLVPDLQVSGLTAGIAADNPNGSFTIPVSYTVTNIGPVAATLAWTDVAALSADGALDAGDPRFTVHSRTSSLPSGESYTVSANVTTSTTTAPGNYTLFVAADGAGTVAETGEANNVAGVAVTLRIRAVTTTAMSSSVRPSVVGQGTTLTASVTPSTATGMVTFKDGTVTLGSSELASGVATLAASFGWPGAHGLTAVYAGDAYSRPSTSSALTQTVDKAPAPTTLGASSNAVLPNATVTFTAGVGGVAPTGAVTFKDGSTVIGSSIVQGGVATLSKSFANVGLHRVTATYAGDANNLANVSVPLVLEVLSDLGPDTPRAWSYGYDAGGNQTYVVDPNGHRTDRTLNRLGHVAAVTQPAPSPGGARPVIGYTYDGEGAVSSVTDPRSLTTTYAIDGLGHTHATASPDTGTTGATYDAAGNILTRTDSRGLTTTYAYDSLNRLSSIGYASGTPSVFEYDGGATPVPASIGKLTRFTDESGRTAYTHDALGRVVTKTQVTGTRDFVMGYGWGGSGGGNGKLTSIAYPSGAQVNYLYDATGRVTGISLNPVNASGSGTDSGVTLTVLSGLAYTGANQPRAWTWGDGVPYQRSFDRNGRLVSYPLGNPAGGGAVRTLSYDYASRIIGYSHAGAGALDQSFAYDGLDRLIDANQGGTLHGYGYDATGNRIQRKVGAQLFVNGVSATSNRLTTVQDGSGTTTLGYDAAGNIVSDAIGSYTYSARGRMSAATLGGGTVQYRYNALEQRVSKTGPAALVPTGASYYAYDEAGRLIGEYDADGVPRYETIYLGDTPVAVITQTRSGSPVTVQTQVAFIYADHIDTPRVIARSGDHGIVWRWDQAEAFGATPADDNPDGLGSFTFNQRFPGQVFDAETGLHQNVNREYDPPTGRYRQFDPTGLADGPNGYLYLHGDPLRGTDPMGLANSAATFWMRGKEPPNKPKHSQMCENDHHCENTITVSVGGNCEAGDSMCVMSLRAAGFNGPFTREYRAYDWKCLLRLGFGVKATGALAGNAFAAQAPAVARALDAGAQTLRIVEGGVAIFTHPAVTVGGLGVGLYAVAKECECKVGAR